MRPSVLEPAREEEPRRLGDVPLSATMATAIAEFQRTRHDKDAANRTCQGSVFTTSDTR